LTAVTIVEAIRGQVVDAAVDVFVCGGGVHNAALQARLRALAPAWSWQATDALGVAADWVEAMAFAWLAHRTLEGQPGNIASVTGARGERVLGAVYPR